MRGLRALDGGTRRQMYVACVQTMNKPGIMAFERELPFLHLLRGGLFVGQSTVALFDVLEPAHEQGKERDSGLHII
jgi:hypothetical protein